MKGPMKRSIFVISFLFMMFSLDAFVYAQEKVIKLRDGVVLHGKILSKEGNVYKIASDMLGVLSVKESDVIAIEEAAPPASEWANYQRKIVDDPRVMESIQNLATDPQVLQLLSDPQLKAAIMRQDLDALKNNQNFIKFANNPTVKKIVNDVSASEEKESQVSKELKERNAGR